MYRSDIICVTNRIICESSGEPFLDRIKKVAEAHPHAIILREKDLNLSEYRVLAEKVSEISSIILHNFYELVLEDTNCSDSSAEKNDTYTRLHMPLWKLAKLRDENPDIYARLCSRLKELGASCHSVEDAVLAESLGCTYIIAGHIYNTDCKKGLEGRGLDFLKEVAASVKIPVYAIGGITPDNIREVRNAGAAGACIMSSAMLCDNPAKLIKSLCPN